MFGRLRRVMVRLLGAVTVAILVLPPPMPSQARAIGAVAEPEPSLRQLYDQLGVTGARTHYVVGLDGSEATRPMLAGIKRQLTTFLGHLPPTDQVTLIIFDQKVSRIVSPLTQTDIEQITTGSGDAIDIGRAAESAVSQLEAGPSTRAAMAFLMAGEHRPAADSPYASTAGMPWAELLRRADRLTSRTRLRVYPFSYANNPDVQRGQLRALAPIFPTSVDVDYTGTRNIQDLNQVRDDVLRSSALEALQGDRSKNVVAEWPTNPPKLDPGSERAEIKLTLRSTLQKLPLKISDLRVSVTGSDPQITARLKETRPIDLAPGAAKTVAIELSWTQDPKVIKGPVRVKGTLSVTGRVSMPWASQVASIGLRDVNPRLIAQPVTLSGEGTGGIPKSALIGGITAIFIVIVIVLIFLILPPDETESGVSGEKPSAEMSGSLTARYVASDLNNRDELVTKDAGPVSLTGHREVTTDELVPDRKGEVTVRMVTNDQKGDSALLIEFQPHGRDHSSKGTCPMGGRVLINGVEFIHHTDLEPSAVRDTGQAGDETVGRPGIEFQAGQLRQMNRPGFRGGFSVWL